MAAKFFDVYLRLAGAKFSSFTLTSNVLSGWDPLHFVPEKAKCTLEPTPVQLSDGSQLCEFETPSVEVGTMRVDKATFDYLRSTYHNQLCDFLMVDPEQDDFCLAAFGLMTNVYLVVESGETMVIKITATRKKAVGSDAVLIGSNIPSCHVAVLVTNTTGVPVAGASVSIAVASPSRTYTDTTDSDGMAYFIIETPAAPTTTTGTMTVTKSGGWVFTSNVQVTVNRHGEYYAAVPATTNGS